VGVIVRVYRQVGRSSHGTFSLRVDRKKRGEERGGAPGAWEGRTSELKKKLVRYKPSVLGGTREVRQKFLGKEKLAQGTRAQIRPSIKRGETPKKSEGGEHTNLISLAAKGDRLTHLFQKVLSRCKHLGSLQIGGKEFSQWGDEGKSSILKLGNHSLDRGFEVGR